MLVTGEKVHYNIYMVSLEEGATQEGFFNKMYKHCRPTKIICQKCTVKKVPIKVLFY